MMPVRIRDNHDDEKKLNTVPNKNVGQSDGKSRSMPSPEETMEHHQIVENNKEEEINPDRNGQTEREFKNSEDERNMHNVNDNNNHTAFILSKNTNIRKKKYKGGKAHNKQKRKQRQSCI